MPATFDLIQPGIRERLEWGARITPSEIAALRQRLAGFNARMDDLFSQHQLLLLPCAPCLPSRRGRRP